MIAKPCPFCGAPAIESETWSGHFGCNTAECPASHEWNELVYWNQRSFDVEIQKELAAYQALSGGKTAMEYALFVDGINKIEEKILFFLDQMENIAKNTGKTEYYINYIKEIRGEFEEKTK